MKLKFGILALDIALYNSYDFYSGQIRTLTMKTWKRDLLLIYVAKKCWKAVLYPQLSGFFFTCIHEKAGFLFSNKSSTHLLVALKVIYHMM